MHFRRDERGSGALKGLISLAVIAYIVFAAVKIVGAKSNDGYFEAKVREVLKYAGVNRSTRDDLRFQIDQSIKEFNVPLSIEDVTIEERGREWHLSLSYERAVPLVVWTWRKKYSIDASAPKE